jgi:formylmethanofuran dehydrogenase subunit B
MSGGRRVEHVTCLGCGCSCDDVTVTVDDDRIVAADPLCPVGRAWMGDGRVPAEVSIEGRTASLEEAIQRAAGTLRGEGRSLVYLGPDVTSQAQRAALAVADLLRATVGSSTSGSAAHGLVTAQRRGRVSATLGEIRNRGDALLFWGVDPRERYPRFLARYGLEPIGTHVPQGRRGRDVISVNVGADRALPEADMSLELAPDQEILALSFLRALVLGVTLPAGSAAATLAAELAPRLTRARYAVVVHDAEPTALPRNPLRVEGLIALTEALNGPTRAALCSLRAGGNRVGAEAVLTSQTGYPLGVDYARGYPRYDPGVLGLEELGAGVFRAVLVVGSPPLNDKTRSALAAVSTVVVGPRATQSAFKATVAIDTGVAGVHEGGTAYRMDEVPLRLRPPLQAPRSAADVLHSLAIAVRPRSQGSTPP